MTRRRAEYVERLALVYALAWIVLAVGSRL